ncbi:MAG: resolvase [Rickettsiales bacterium]|nr:resolvase [Rickettsiales bacterium]OUW02620.1 MAG: hypothetical protein CBD16_04080 [Betaproteobacteria bacterium TMED156]
MKSVAYIRVSTTDQHLENQKISIEREATRNTDSIGHFYQDHAVSGVQTKRDGLQQLICDARKNKFQRLYVYDLSRLSRSVKHLLETVEILKDLNIELVIIREKIDTSTPTGKFFLTVLGSLYELERSIITERSKAGVERARRNGVKFGRPTIVTENLKSAVKLLREQGIGIKKISNQLGIGVSTVYSCL